MPSPQEQLLAVVADHGLQLEHPPAVMQEVAAWVRSPGIDDPALLDLRDVPFVSIDGPDTRDLDQALHVARRDSGFLVRYALATKMLQDNVVIARLGDRVRVAVVDRDEKRRRWILEIARAGVK